MLQNSLNILAKLIAILKLNSNKYKSLKQIFELKKSKLLNKNL